jgi:hypothetical protein
MADHVVSCADLESITDSLEAAVKAARHGDRVVLNMDQAKTLLETIAELWDEIAESKEAGERKPKFFHVAKPGEIYLQASTISLVILDPQGNAIVQTISGATIKVEALQWGLMRDAFHAAIDLEDVRSTQGLVSA